MAKDNFTLRIRKAVWLLWALVIVSAVAGWFFDKDPSKLAPVIGWITAGPLIGEAANIGKRATWKKEAHEATS